MCRLNPKVDSAFKKLFGSEENKDILIAFINSIIDEKEVWYDIEMQIAQQDFFHKRADVFYTG